MNENAHVALNQAEYQNRYNALVERFVKAKARLDAVNAEICDKRNRQATIESFLEEIKQLDVETEFQSALWYFLADFMTVYCSDNVRITFKDGMEIRA